MISNLAGGICPRSILRGPELGLVEATSGTAFEMGTFESSVAKLQRSAHARGATAVMVLDHSKNQMADQASGMAIRCK